VVGAGDPAKLVGSYPGAVELGVVADQLPAEPAKGSPLSRVLAELVHGLGGNAAPLVLAVEKR